MVLALVVHTVPDRPSAKVALSMIALLDLVKRRDVPAELKCRQVFPTSGQRSTSLWDVPDLSALQSWLDEYLEVEVSNEVFEVQEDFCYGMSAELTRVRTTERLAGGARALGAAVNEKTKPATDAASAQMADMDARYKVSAQTQAALKTAQETGSAAAKSTAAMFNRMSLAAKAQYAKALQNDKVAGAASTAGQTASQLGSNIQKLSASWWGGGSQRGSPTHPDGPLPDTDEPVHTAQPSVRMGGFASGPREASPASAQPAKDQGPAAFTLDELDGVHDHREPKEVKAGT